MGRPRAPFAGMPVAARAFLLAVLGVAATASVAALAGVHRDAPWTAFAILAAASAAAQLFVVRAARNQAYHTTIAFLVPAAVVLPPGLVVLLVLCQHLPECLRERYRWYIASFNVANYALDTLAAGAVYRALEASPLDRGPIAVVAAALALVFANHALLALMLRLGRGHSIRATGLFSRASLATDLAPALIGVMLLVEVSPDNPWLVPAAILPLFYLSRSMTVPALHRAETLLKTRAERQSYLIDLGRGGITTSSADEIVARALAIATDCLGAERAHLVEVTEEGRPRLRGAVGAPPAELAGVLVADQLVDGAASVTVRGASGPIGVLAVHRSTGGAFAPEDVEFLDGIATTISVTLERERSQAALARSEERREQLLGEMLRAEAEERLRIATELHDDTIQVMTATLLRMDSLGGALDRADLERAGRSLVRARTTLADAVERTRRLTFELRPPLLEANGLACALAELGEQVGREAGFEAAVAVDVGRYPTMMEDLTYRIVQEAVANVRKHARARHVTIELAERDGVLHGAVHDDGVGFDVATALDRSRMRLHLGLDALIERVRLAGGDVDIEAAPGAGARLRFWLPLATHARRAAPAADRVLSAA